MDVKCHACGQVNPILTVKKDSSNKGRKFSKCNACGAFKWHDGDVPLFGADASPVASVKSTLPKRAMSGSVPNRGTKDNEWSSVVPNASIAPSAQGATTSPTEFIGANAVENPLSSSVTSGFAFLKKPISQVIASAKPFTPSVHQQRIFDEVQNGSGNIRNEAVAGSGKTTTNVKACDFIPQNKVVKMMVFSKANQLDMEKRVPSHVEATTSHAAGYKDIRRAFPKVMLDEKKMWTLLNDQYEFNDEVKLNGSEIVKLVSLCKNTLRQPTEENIDWLCERFGISPNGSQDTLYAAVKNLFETSEKVSETLIDFDDMIYLPAIGKVAVDQCDVLFVDEAQDTNAAQQAYYLKAVKHDGRIIFVGDVHQAIFGFRGADTEAMDNLSAALNPVQLPLSICYRCPSKVIELAKQIVPQIEPRQDAPEGIVEDLDYTLLTSKVKSGDMVLCRMNAPLVRPAFELIRNGIKAVIRGRDIGKNLMQLVKKIQKKYRSFHLYDMLTALSNYVMAEEYKLLTAKKENQAQMLRDQLETIVALSDGCNTVSELEYRINQVFSDDVQGVVFSTSHKAKGLEADRVFVLKPELLNPQKFDTQDWQLTQLMNLKYVTWTRAMQELYFVRGNN